MKHMVVVENTLDDVAHYLEDQGYEVRTIYKNDTLFYITSGKYEGIIVEDLDDIDLRGNLDTDERIIEAKDRSPRQILETLKSMEMKH